MVKNNNKAKDLIKKLQKIAKKSKLNYFILVSEKDDLTERSWYYKNDRNLISDLEVCKTDVVTCRLSKNRKKVE